MARSTKPVKQHGTSDDSQFDESWSPRIEALVGNEHLSLRVELPGFAADEIEVEIIDAVLVIRGERQESHIKRVCGCYTDEIRFLVFSRKIQLPSGTNANAAIATFHEGVLQVTMQFFLSVN